MIARLQGLLWAIDPPHVLLNVNGVGYQLACSEYTIAKLEHQGQQYCLHTHMHVREDDMSLFGFYEEAERQLFRMLIKVNGVGPKLALTILSTMHRDQLVAAILGQDAKCITAVPGIGKKTAERLIIDLRDHIAALEPSADPLPLGSPNNMVQDAISALLALGYQKAQAIRTVKDLANDVDNTEQLVRESLKRITEYS